MMKPLASRSRRPVFNVTSYVIFEKSCICSCLSFLICKLRRIALTSLDCWRAPVSVCVKCSEQPCHRSLCVDYSLSQWKPFFVVRVSCKLEKHGMEGSIKRTDIFHWGSCFWPCLVSCFTRREILLLEVCTRLSSLPLSPHVPSVQLLLLMWSSWSHWVGRGPGRRFCGHILLS